MTTDNVHCSETLRIVLLISFLLLVPAPKIRAQQSGLHGAVLDSTGAPIQGAQIEFNSGTATALAATDAQGKFSLTDVTGNGTLLARYPGFSSADVSVGPDSYERDLGAASLSCSV